MVSLPSEYVLNSTLNVGVVYKLKAPELIDTSVPHYFIIVAIDEDDNYMVLCTTQLESKIEYFKRNNINLDTLVYLSPSGDNGFSRDTYVNCNDYHYISKDSLIDKIDCDTLSFEGVISNVEYDKISQAIISSDINDLPAYLLSYPPD